MGRAYNGPSTSRKEIENFIEEIRKLTPTLSIKGGFDPPIRRSLRELPKISGNKNFQIVDLEMFNLREPSLILVESKERELIYVAAGSTLGMNTHQAWGFFDMNPTEFPTTTPHDTLILWHNHATPLMSAHAKGHSDHRYFVRAVSFSQIKKILKRLNSKVSGFLIFEHDDLGMIRALARLISTGLFVPSMEKLTSYERKTLFRIER